MTSDKYMPEHMLTSGELVGLSLGTHSVSVRKNPIMVTRRSKMAKPRDELRKALLAPDAWLRCSAADILAKVDDQALKMATKTSNRRAILIWEGLSAATGLPSLPCWMPMMSRVVLVIPRP